MLEGLDCMGQTPVRWKNTTISYGLTLVAGLPLPAAPTAEAMAVQAQFERRFPGRFIWYDASHLHVTLAAPLRSRYRAAPPLQRSELPGDLDRFVAGLGELLARIEPFVLELGLIHLDDEGTLLIDVHGGTDVKARVTAWLAHFPECDPPKHPLNHLHISVGYLRGPTVDPALTDDLSAALKSVLPATHSTAPVRILVDRVWLVHYTSRTLNRVVGKIPFALGRSNRMTVAQFLKALGIPEGQHVEALRAIQNVPAQQASNA